MRSTAVVLFTVSGILTTATVRAAEPEPAMTAGDLQALCTGEDHVSENACRIYILGVTQGIAVGMHMAGGQVAGGAPCVPPGTSAEALEETVKSKLGQDLAKRPGDRNLEASGFIGSVLAAAYPCAKHPQSNG
ncbi:MAG TPA: Rap1a/Tai family immunity protein [Steroidobacteraceae bacterium]|nr:Rap1a/Tai family immunity protein [Steroidobacteraceae bacterium]